MIISFRDIPDDLEEMIDAGEFCCSSYSDNFEKCMFFHNLMKQGNTRRSHRIITQKCKDIGVDGTIELLTGKSMKSIIKKQNKKTNKKRIKEMFKIAKEFGYELKKINIKRI